MKWFWLTNNEKVSLNVVIKRDIKIILTSTTTPQHYYILVLRETNKNIR